MASLDDLRAPHQKSYALHAPRLDTAPGDWMAPVYDENAPLYAHVGQKYWPGATQHLVDLAGLSAGETVFDMACGPGAVTLRAARRVAPNGWVHGGDISHGMLAEAQREAMREGVLNVGFFPTDFYALPYAPATFDAVTCAFAIFLAPDYPQALRNLWAIVRPGGVLAVSTFAEDHYTPLLPVYLDAVRAYSQVDLEPLLLAQRLFAPDALSTIFSDAGIPGATVTYRANPIAISTIADWWEIVAGTGNRRIQTALTDDEAARVRAAVDDFAARESVTTLGFGVNYAVARKPA